MTTRTVALELLLLIIISQYSPGRFEDFTNSPGIFKTDPGRKAVMTWRLSRIFNAKAYFASVNIKKTDTDTLVIAYRHPTTKCDTKGDNRRDCILPNTTGFIVGFSIASVRESDAGQYRITVTQDVDSGTIKDSDAFVYVFKSPAVQLSGNREATEGDSITLTCTATSQSLPVSLRYTAKMVYTWTIDNPEGNHVVNGNRVTIKTTNKGNQGASFTCVVKEDGSTLTRSDKVVLNILYKPGKPQLSGVPTQALIEDKDRLSVTCQLSANDLGNPQVNHYIWRNINSSYHRDTGNNNKLILSSVNAKQHDGVWQCQPENSVGQGQLAQFKVIVNAKPSVSKDLSSILDVVNTGLLSVSCSFRAKPGASITWIYEDDNNLTAAISYRESDVNVDRVYTQTTSTLSWRQQVAPDDPRRRQAGGRYRCHAVNTVGYRESSIMELNVQYAPYDIHLNTSQLTVTEGDHLTVQCISECNPTCRFTWTRQNDDSWSDNNDALILSDISQQFSDIFTCQAENNYGMKKSNLTVIVNFAPEIISFGPASSGDIIQDNTLNITCEVSSRPKSTITITNINTSDIILSVSDTHKAVYTFDRVHVLDSGLYQCSATNGIKPQTDVTRQMILDVKGGCNFCEPSPTEEGVPLKANVTVTFCVIANPFREISNINWTFRPNGIPNMTNNLPDNVLISIQETSHPYKKYIKLMISSVSERHYGIYTLKVKNIYNIKEVKHDFNLLPEGPPVSPTNITVTYITAVSIDLEWMAGFDGGPDQTFWLYVFDRTTSDWFTISNIDDTSRGQDGLIAYKLTQEQGVVPDHKYIIRVGAINSISNVTGDSVMAHTKALPHFEGDEPEIVYSADTAEITWPVDNLDSVNNILIEICSLDKSICSPAVNITTPEIQPYVIPLPEGDTKTYALTFTFYDGKDVVYIKETAASLVNGLPLVAIIGGILGGLIAAAVVITVIILWRKGYFAKGIRKTSDRLQQKRRLDQNSPGYTNPALDITEASNDEINPYGTTSFSNSKTSATPQTDAETSGVINRKVGPITGDLYAEVNKQIRQVPSESDHQSSNKAAAKGQTMASSKPAILPKRKDQRASVYPPESATVSQQSNSPMYAEVKKKQEKRLRQPRSKHQECQLADLNGERQGEKQGQYINVLSKESQDGAYSEVQIHKKRDWQTNSQNDSQYANKGKNNAKRMVIGPDDILYADLDIIDKPPADPDVIHGKENLVEYASIDFSKLKN